MGCLNVRKRIVQILDGTRLAADGQEMVHRSASNDKTPESVGLLESNPLFMRKKVAWKAHSIQDLFS